VTLPAFAAERLAAALLLLSAGASCRSISAVIDKPAAGVVAVSRSDNGTDRQTDGRPTVS